MNQMQEQIIELSKVVEKKLDKENVTYSGSITQPGYALDARQGNAYINDSMANKIKIIDDNLSSFHPNETAAMKNFDDPSLANVILYNYSGGNWAGIGTDPGGSPIIRYSSGSYRLAHDGIYHNGTKITD